MSKASNFFKTTAILSTALLSLLGACAIEDPIDYTTDGYTSGPQGGGSGDESSEGDDSADECNMGSSSEFAEWTRQLGTSSSDRAHGIATDINGNVYVTGTTYGALEGSNASPVDLFVVKYDSGGTDQWIRQLDISNYDQANGVATDSSGNVYVTGNTAHPSGGSIFVVKYDSAGVKKWTQQLGTTETDVANGIATDSSGNVYVTGTTHWYGALDNNTNAGKYDLFVIKYDSAGVKKWTQQLGTTETDEAFGIATDSSGNVYVTGFTEGALEGSNAGNKDLFVVKYDSGGNKQWTQQLGTSEFDVARGVATDSNGNVYVTGATFGSLEGTPAGSQDIFVVKYDSAGDQKWIQQLGTSCDDVARGIATDSSGNVYVTGYTGGAPDGSNAGNEDIFVVKYDSAGDQKWTEQLGTSDWDEASGIATDSSGNVYVTGFTYGALEGSNAGEYDLFVMKLK